MATNRVRIDGAELPYLDEGDGRPVLFVHGGISDHRLWDAHRPTITPRYRMIAPTQRYFGSTPWHDDGRRFSIQTHAEDLACFIGALRLDPVAVVGWCWISSTRADRRAMRAPMSRIEMRDVAAPPLGLGAVDQMHEGAE